jgi:RHS repeat-associated protein
VNGEAVTDFGFTSQRNEASFGLMDYNARYYSPRLGRFVSPDSIVPEPGSSGGFNRYRYTRNNPLKYTDPSGHEPCTSGNWGDCQKSKPKYKKPPTTPPDQEQKQLENYDPNLPAGIGAVTSGLGVPAGYATATYYLGKPYGAFPAHPIEYIPTTVNKFGSAATVGIPIYNGYINGGDINARQNFGMISEYEAPLEHTNNAAFTTLNVVTNGLMLKAATPTFVIGSSSTTVATILASPATIALAVPSIGMVTAWEQQTINNMIEGMPREQAWKTARDTTFEPVLNLFGATRV